MNSSGKEGKGEAPRCPLEGGEGAHTGTRKHTRYLAPPCTHMLRAPSVISIVTPALLLLVLLFASGGAIASQG